MSGIQITTVQTNGITEDTIKETAQAFASTAPGRFVVGTQIQDGNTLQITSDWPSSTTLSASDSTIGAHGQQTNKFHVALDRPVFGKESLAESNVIEFAQSWFPVSQATPEFQKKIDDDFERFDEIFRTNVPGNLGFAKGWVQEELEHQNIKGEKTKSFIIIRGWEKMSQFEDSVQTENFQSAIKILYAWNAPFKMVRTSCESN